MESSKTSRQIQYLASVLSLVGSYYAIRATLVLPKFHHLLMDFDGSDQHSSIGRFILQHPNWFLILVIITCITTQLAVWKVFKFHDLMAPFGICLQFFLAERAAASVLDPIIEMISIMAQ